VGAAALRRLFARMEAEGRRRLGPSFPGEVRIERAVDMRYGEQVFEVTVPLGGVDVDGPDLMTQVVDRFHRRHEELFTYCLREQDPVLVNARLAVVGRLPALPEERTLPARAEAAPRTHRAIYLAGEWVQAPVWDLETMAPGQRITGPAVVETATTTVLLQRGDRASVTPLGWLDISLTG
jgi:N-methylhydantoinase A